MLLGERKKREREKGGKCKRKGRKGKKVTKGEAKG
jgi:hypothetical protein